MAFRDAALDYRWPCGKAFVGRSVDCAPNETYGKCRALDELRWPDGPECPRCGDFTTISKIASRSKYGVRQVRGGEIRLRLVSNSRRHNLEGFITSRVDGAVSHRHHARDRR